MKYSIASLPWIMVGLSAFMIGVKVRDVNDPLIPVLVASKTIEQNTSVSPTDFRIELRRSSSVSDGVLTEPSQIQKNSATTRKLIDGQQVLSEDVEIYFTESYFNLPRDHCLYAIRLSNKNHSLQDHLLTVGDTISLHAVYENDECAELTEQIYWCNDSVV